MYKIRKLMTLHHEKYKRKRWWVFWFIVNQNLHYRLLSTNQRGKGVFNKISLITIIIQLSNTIISWHEAVLYN